MRVLQEYIINTQKSNTEMKTSIDSMKSLKVGLNEIIKGLESRRQTLPILGTKIAEIEPVLTQRNLAQMSQNCQKNLEKKAQMVESLQKFSSSLQICTEKVNETQDKMEILKRKVLQEESMKLSLEQAANDDLKDLIDNLVCLPPEPKLIDI